MNKFPELLVRLFPRETLTKLKRLHSTYTGLHLQAGSKEYSIIEEVEHSIFAATLGNVEYDIDQVLKETLEGSAYSNIDVFVKGNVWNPLEESFKEFKINNLDHGDPQVIHNEHSTFCLKQYFLEMRI
jgi:hypothetical protein